MKIYRDNPVSGQRGAASIAIAIVILLIMTAALITSQTLTGSAVQDAAASDLRVQALFLAESGLERGTRSFLVDKLNCNTAPPETKTIDGVGIFTITYWGSSDFNTAACTSACSSSSCRIRSSGTFTGANNTTLKATRTIEAIVQAKGSNSAGSSTALGLGTSTVGHQHYVLQNTVTPGLDQVFALTVLWVTSKNGKKSGNLLNITYDGVNMQRLVPALGSVLDDKPYVSIYLITSPPVGTRTVDLDFTDPVSSLAVGTMNLDGVDLVATASIPATAAVSASAASSIGASVTIPANGIVLDVVAKTGGGQANPMPCGTMTETSLFPTATVNGNSSYCGPEGAVGETFNMGYTFISSDASYAKLVLKANISSASGSRVRLGGGGGSKWHEILSTPP